MRVVITILVVQQAGNGRCIKLLKADHPGTSLLPRSLHLTGEDWRGMTNHSRLDIEGLAIALYDEVDAATQVAIAVLVGLVPWSLSSSRARLIGSCVHDLKDAR